MAIGKTIVVVSPLETSVGKFDTTYPFYYAVSMSEIMRVPSGKASQRFAECLRFVHTDPENIILFSVYQRDVAYLLSPSEFVKYQQWKQHSGLAHPGLRPSSLDRGKIRLKSEPVLVGHAAKNFDKGLGIKKPNSYRFN